MKKIVFLVSMLLIIIFIICLHRMDIIIISAAVAIP